ncbi:MAG TPA: aldehyde dehydrogenase family protein, partial [Acidobacteriota bacterium]|nr:aldehyde dehydrogenase family protein [Acidobacteriota bacterium]
MIEYRTLNPATGQLVRRYEAAGEKAVERALRGSWQAFQDYKTWSFEQRAEKLTAAAELLEDRASRLGTLMAEEMGKPLAEGRAEAEKCAWACRYFAQHGPSYLTPEERPSDAGRSLVRYDPLGPVLAIMPW